MIAIIFLGFGDEFDFDVFEGHHGEYLANAGEPAAEEILEDVVH